MEKGELRSKARTGGPSPELSSNFFYYFTWQWVQPLVSLGNKKTVEAEDLYDLNPGETTAHCEQKWNRYCEDYKKRTGNWPSVWRLVYISSGREMLHSFIACPFWLAFIIAQVYMIRVLVQLAGERNKYLAWWRGLLLVLGMFAASVCQSLAQHYSLNEGQKSGIKIRAAVSMAVFNKLLKLKTVALNGTSTGQMLNIITNDTQKLLDTAYFAAFSLCGIIFSIIVAAISVGEVGISAIPGVAVIILAQFVQVFIAQRVGELRKHAVKFTDARVRTTQEILSGVRVVKYNGWTDAFLSRIQDLRKAEMAWIRKAGYFRSSPSTLREVVSPLAALATFGTYVGLHGGGLSASKAFTILGLYSVLVRVYSIGPAGVLAAWESRVGIQRLQNLLTLPEGCGNGSDDELQQIKKISSQPGLAISRGTFSWHLKNQQGTGPSAHATGKDNIPNIRLCTSERRTNKSSTSVSKGSRPHGASDEDGNMAHQDGMVTLKDINLTVRSGELIAIVGAVGSGKSSLLLAILEEMECLSGGIVLQGAVSYAPQQPWILNETIKNNIIFANDYNDRRYKETLHACALSHDIETMPAGDDTEIGERGVNLSGGQKARISLARACYNLSSVVLLDDPLAAVDVPTANHLIQHVLCGILKGRTVILVTHNKSSLELCDRVFLMNNGTLQSVDSKEDVIQEILEADNELDAVAATLDSDENLSSSFRTTIKDNGLQMEEESADLEPPRISTSPEISKIATSFSEIYPVTRNSGDSIRTSRKSNSAKESRQVSLKSSFGGDNGSVEDALASARLRAMLTVKEDQTTGKIHNRTYAVYLKGGGLGLWALVIFLMCFAQGVRVMVDYWVSIWVNSKYNLSTNLYLGIYGAWIGGLLTLTLSRGILFTEAAIRAAKSMHSLMAASVLRSPQVFFDQNPVGRIINRFSKDQAMIDELLPWTAQNMTEYLVGVLGVMVLVAVIMPWFLLVLPIFLVSLWYCHQRYVMISRELRRLDGVSRSPIYAHFTQTLQGITSVRAYRQQEAMHDRFRDLIDANHRAFFAFIHTTRWLGVRLDFSAAICLTAVTTLSIILRGSIAPGVIGVVLVQSLQLTGFFQYGVRLVAETENYFTSVERNQAYANLPSEANPKSPSGLISDSWPEKGEVEFKQYTMAYRDDLPTVLNDLTFMVHPEEKIGILGRTGAGKSSLAAALFRMVENAACSGSIYVDGINIAHVGLDDLRLRLSIIPQDPVLFRGTVRLNLDPFERHSDIEIFEAIAKVQLTAKVRSLEAGLDSIVDENGSNFSVGQRQLLCLARSLLRRSKIIVMDEATAAVDGDTDQLIQSTMRNVFRNCTVLTIAHRIDTVIDCDRVLVLATGGRVAEFDSPVNLLRRAENVNLSDPSVTPTDHIFASMVTHTGSLTAKQLREAAEEAERKRLGFRESHDHREPS